MKQLLILTLFSLLSFSCQKGTNSIQSPNRELTAIYNQQNGFTIYYQGEEESIEMMNIPQIGLVTSLNKDSLQLVSISPTVLVVDDYEMLTGKRKHCHNEANECIYRFKNSEGLLIDFILRVYNDGIAFRYHFPETAKNITIYDENTSYAFAPDIKRWTQEFMVGYEGFYHPNTDGIGKNKSMNWNFPALFQTSGNAYVLLTEANIQYNNTGAYLNNSSNSSIYQIKLSDEQQTCGTGWYSPWRVAIMGTLNDIVESTLVTDVSEPCKLEDTSWIKPGLVSWIYWAYNHGSKDYKIVKKYIDFADDFDLPYVLIDWEWDVMSNGGNLTDALNYCKEKGIDPLLWYNSSTAWAVPTPLYRLNTSEARDKEFKWLKEMGIQGIKVDFFGGDSIATMNYYIDILEDAAKHKILVNFHGAAIPRGWQRTYPNFMSSEAVYGAEWYNNNATLTNQAAWHNCTLPFTRNVIGPMDYTPCTFTDSQHPHITSDAHELALLVAFESGLQHLADRPEGYQQQPEEVQSLIKQLPTAWEDTKLLSGYPSEYIIIARKSKEGWYIAGLNGTEEIKPFSVDLSFIQEPIETIQFFSDSTEGEKMKLEVPSVNNKNLNIECQPRGGFVLYVKS